MKGQWSEILYTTHVINQMYKRVVSGLNNPIMPSFTSSLVTLLPGSSAHLLSDIRYYVYELEEAVTSKL